MAFLVRNGGWMWVGKGLLRLITSPEIH